MAALAIFSGEGQWAGQTYHCNTELLDPENVGVAFGVSLQFSIDAEIMRYFICTSGNGGHL